MQIDTAEELPTTSAAAASTAANVPKFTKFLHTSKRNTNQDLRLLALKRLNSNTAERSVANKILRTIKKRKAQFHLQNTISTPKFPGKELRRKLDFANLKETEATKITTSVDIVKCSIIKKKSTGTKTAETLEDGEIVSSDNEDDCVCIEPEVELITIDDESHFIEPAKFISSTIVEIAATSESESKNSVAAAITSTPLEKTKSKNLISSVPNSPSAATKSILNNDVKTETNNSDVELFFKDVSRTNWLETITSEDTFADYVKTTTPLGSGISPARRSRRLRGKEAEIIVDDDIILLDDNTLEADLSDRTLKAKPDDSVLFVSEHNPSAFIPLDSDDVPNPIKFVPNPITPNRQRRAQNISLFTQSEKKQLTKYNDNAYNPDAGEKLLKGKRMVLIDGSNVAFSHGLNQEFSVKGLKICLDYFEKMGHEAKAVVPQFRLNRYKSSDPKELEALHRAGKIVFTPCKNLPNAKSISYDDRFVLQIACELDAAIVSNDNYRDLINESPAMKKLIENRVIGYTWCNDIFMLPKDPYGRFGPTLHSILNR